MKRKQKMKEIKLTQGKVALVDDESFEALNQFKWYAQKGRNTWYAARNERLPNGKQKVVLMHRQILGILGKWSVIDHEDGNGLNNCCHNIRECSHGENLRNKKTYKTNKSGFRGVFWNKRTQKWIAQVFLNKKCIFSRSFETKELAAVAYNEAAIKHHGDFAMLNTV